MCLGTPHFIIKIPDIEYGTRGDSLSDTYPHRYPKIDNRWSGIH